MPAADTIALQLLAEVPAARSAQYVDADDNLAVVSNGGAGVQLIGIADPANPVVLSTVRPHRSSPAGRVMLEAGRLYVALDDAGFGIVDVSAPTAPNVLLPRQRKFNVKFD